MARKLSQFTSREVCSVIFNQSTSFQSTNVSRYVSCCLVRLKIDLANTFLGAEVVHTSEAKDEERKKMNTFWFLGLNLSLSHLPMLINQSRKETLILFTECMTCTQNRERGLGVAVLHIHTKEYNRNTR